MTQYVELHARSAFSFLGSLHILVFLVALGLAIAIAVLSRMDALVPAWVVALWPWRAGIVAAAIFVSVVFFLLERLVGFGLERIVLGLFAEHGLDPDRWPHATRKRLWQ